MLKLKLKKNGIRLGDHWCTWLLESTRTPIGKIGRQGGTNDWIYNSFKVKCKEKLRHFEYSLSKKFECESV